jgi:hypothetical protein
VVELPFAADCCPCVEKLRTMLPLTVGIRVGAVQLVSNLGASVAGRRRELIAHKALFRPTTYCEINPCKTQEYYTDSGFEFNTLFYTLYIVGFVRLATVHTSPFDFSFRLMFPPKLSSHAVCFVPSGNAPRTHTAAPSRARDTPTPTPPQRPCRKNTFCLWMMHHPASS